MTHNVDRAELETYLYGILTPEVANVAVGVLLEKYDVTEKPEPIGTVRVGFDPRGKDSAVYVRVSEGPNGWAAVYFGSRYEAPTVYSDGRAPFGTTAPVFTP